MIQYLVVSDTNRPSRDAYGIYDSHSKAWAAYKAAKLEMFMASRRGTVTIAKVIETMTDREIEQEAKR